MQKRVMPLLLSQQDLALIIVALELLLDRDIMGNHTIAAEKLLAKLRSHQTKPTH
jgi:hypothetical protein